MDVKGMQLDEVEDVVTVSEGGLVVMVVVFVIVCVLVGGLREGSTNCSASQASTVG